MLRPQQPPVLVLLLLVTASGCTRPPKEKEARFLESGKQFMLGKDYARAALQFRNAIQVMPRNAEAYYQLGLASLAAGNLNEAVSALKKATELNPGHAGAQVKLAELMALSGIRDVVQEGEKRMQGVLRTSPDNVDALDALALNEFQLGKWQDAEKHLQQALDKFPQSVKSSVVLARLDLARHDLKGAEEVLKNAIRHAPQSPEAATALGQVYLLGGRWTEAEGQFQAALKINPKFVLALFGLASAQVRLGHKEQAEQTYRAVAALPEKRYGHIYADYLFAEGKRDAAIREFEKLARESPKDRDARTRLVAAYLLTNRVPDAEKILTAVLKTNPKDVDALLQRSQILLRSGKQKEAQGDLIQVLHYRPDSARGHYLLAKIYQAGGDEARHRQELGEAIRLEPAFLSARAELAQSLVTTSSAKAALNLLDEAPQEQKGALPFIIQRNLALLALHDLKEARNGIGRGLALARVPDLLMQDVVLKLMQRDYVGARASANAVLQQNPEDLRALRAVAASYVAQKQPGAALRILQEHAAHYPKSAPIQQFLGEWLLTSGQPAQARVAFAAAKAADPSFIAADFALAQLDVSEGKLDAARKRLGDILSSNRQNPAANLSLGTLEVKAGDYVAAVGHFRKVLEADPHNVPALNNLAYLLVNFANQPDEALTLAQQARELAPESADAEGTLGWVFYRKGLYETAFKYLQEAVARDGESSTQNAAIRKYHLAMTCLKLGERESGLKALNTALKINPNLPEAKIANLALQQNSK